MPLPLLALVAYHLPVLLQLTRCCHQLIATRFRCLRSLLLVNLSSDELIPVSLGLETTAA